MTGKEDGEILLDFHKVMCHAVIFVIIDTNELFASHPAPLPGFPICTYPYSRKMIGVFNINNIYSPKLILPLCLFQTWTSTLAVPTLPIVPIPRNKGGQVPFWQDHFPSSTSTRCLTDPHKLYWGPTHSLCQSLLQQHPLECPEDTDPNEHSRGWGQRKCSAWGSEKASRQRTAKPGKGGSLVG